MKTRTVAVESEPFVKTKIGEEVFKKGRVTEVVVDGLGRTALRPVGRVGKGRSYPRTLPGGYAFKGAWAIKNQKLKREYHAVAKEIGNERVLWHGSDRLAAPNIAVEGMLVGKRGMFGGGIYFGSKEKASHYKPSEKAHLIVCKVALGDIYEADGQDYEMNLFKLSKLGYHSVQGVAGQTRAWLGRLSYDEWVVYQACQVLPMYVGIYERQPSDEGSIDPWQRYYKPIDRDTESYVFRCSFCGRVLKKNQDTTFGPKGNCVTIQCGSCRGRTIFDNNMSLLWLREPETGKRPKKKKKKQKKVGRKRKGN